MPSNDLVKTKLAPKTQTPSRLHNILRPLLIMAVAIVVLASVSLLTKHQGSRILVVNDHRYRLTVADTNRLRAKGLGNQSTMDNAQGMLFTFPASQNLCFWMKDMRFSLDMVWLDDSQRIVKIEQNVSPRTYPKTYCASGQYVIELNAGQAKAAGLRAGQQLHF